MKHCSLFLFASFHFLYKRKAIIGAGALLSLLLIISFSFAGFTFAKSGSNATEATSNFLKIEPKRALPLGDGVESQDVLDQLLQSRFSPVVSKSEPRLQTQTSGEVRYFRETGHSLGGLFLQNFLHTGGLEINGYPLTEPFEKDGLTIQVFERTVMELHLPGSNASFIARRLLGSEQTQGRTFAPGAAQPTNRSRSYFSETGHSLQGEFLNFWRQQGGLEVFGYPLSEEEQEVNPDDGKTYTVQWFERGRFELHPENKAPYRVELGQLGRTFASQLDPALLAPLPEPTNVQHDQVNVPSLMFHHIRKLTNPKALSALDQYSVDPQLFVQMLDWIEANGYHTVTTGQIADYLNQGTALPTKPINLRFDDGWENQLFAAQEMQKRGMTATFFIITQAYTPPYMTRDEVRNLEAMGFEVAAHSRHHPFLTRVGNARDEIVGSKQDLEKLLGHPVRSFAYPYGDLNAQVEGMVRAAGFEIALGVGKGYSWTKNAQFHEPAITMSNVTSLSQFIRRVTNTGW